ncbi:tRNA uridine(34) 5-carboxymethylaminomethyl modification radical SAM/GNAT enzyme Elp3 [Patescibacteria group bacterium]|nr:tRNA uridine(34) 5-carboxymethylaminomethyl modification radical SAM/GNAT enzyme Elp3 [Patescibacteria group bacterium]MBU1952369.1 tRNA uridine(34) 5-carboxymethylaminomethyl modification radical SAM/GNAT enzyme Elp3 [Patescibacteria group bacterium]
MPQKIITQFVTEAIKADLKGRRDLYRFKRQFSKKHQIPFYTNNLILAHYRQLVNKGITKKNNNFVRALRIRDIRTLSGIASIGVHTKSLPCPGKCIYCPTENDMPKSYLSTQPAVMRSMAQKFDPYKMVRTRLRAYYENGHPTDKCELIVMGGTWSYHNPLYQIWYLKRCFDAFNDGISSSRRSRADVNEIKEVKSILETKKRRNQIMAKLKRAQKLNETAKDRVVGITLETRPDFVSKKEVHLMRELGATRVEMGVQSIHDHILDFNKRGHKVEATIRATQLYKDAGFKITYHLMPGLYKATTKEDVEMFKQIFTNPDFQPDQIKIYPTIVSKYSKLYDLWKNGIYKPYSDNKLKALLKEIKLLCPPYVRIARLFRDIPKQSISGGMKITNIRQIIQNELKHEEKFCRCIRCREARGMKVSQKNVKLVKRVYKASGGTEIFLSYESKDYSTIFAFCRLRFPKDKNKDHYICALQNASLLRELHTYGEMIPLSTKKGRTQHIGFGKRLMDEAEKLSKKNGYKKIAVISGIGVRDYYRKLGYQLEDEYMVKKI